MDQNPLNCRLCGESDLSCVYHKPIRAGKPGTQTAEAYRVMACSACGVAFLDPIPHTDENYYASDAYRSTYNEDAAITSYRATHDPLQAKLIERLGVPTFRDRTVGDFGCGGGALLDAAKGYALATYAIEPFKGYHGVLGSAGHRVHASADNLAATEPGVLDLAMSHAVIEHVSDPIGFLSAIRKTMKTGGKLVVSTPNREEILLQLAIPEYEEFYYRTVHPWYFNEKSLRLSMEKAGFSNINISTFHRYDFSNFLCWLRDRKPTGRGALPIGGAVVNAAWIAYLEEAGYAESLWAEAMA